MAGNPLTSGPDVTSGQGENSSNPTALQNAFHAEQQAIQDAFHAQEAADHAAAERANAAARRRPSANQQPATLAQAKQEFLHGKPNANNPPARSRPPRGGGMRKGK